MTGMTVASPTRPRRMPQPPGLPGTPSLGYVLFATRWLQTPLYFGLVVAQGVYVFQFFHELVPLVRQVAEGRLEESEVMLTVLNLVDVVMIANLLIMVIVGGYGTFVSRIGLAGHRDQPEWLSHVNSNVLKVKLATAIVGISPLGLRPRARRVGRARRGRTGAQLGRQPEQPVGVAVRDLRPVLLRQVRIGQERHRTLVPQHREVD